MARQKDIEFTYDNLDELWRLMLGDHADITAAYYNGDFSKSLQQAQKDKHDWIFEGIGFKPGHKIIDMGSGWGPILRAVKERNGEAIGLTLSPKQAQICNRKGLKTLLLDWKELDPAKFGKFDAVVSLGAFEHFCSIEEFLNGEQETIYRNFFKLCRDLLRPYGLLYLQTMTWGKSTPWGHQKLTAQDIKKYASTKAPKKSDEWILGYVKAFFPGSWLPKNKEQIVELAKPYFELIKSSDGRLDYIQTITEWEKAWHAPKPGKLLVKMKLFPNFILKGKAYRDRVKSIEESAVREVFIRNIFGHQRMFFKQRQ